MSFPDLLLARGGDLQVVLFFGGVGLFALLERAWPRRAGDLARRVRWPANATLSALNVLAILAVPISFIGAAAWAEARGWGLLNSGDWPLTFVVAATLGVRAFISFFTHLLNHKLPWLWRLHRVHHLDTELDITSTLRFHPAEMLVNPVLGVPIVVAFGLSPWVLMAYELLDATVTVFSHSNFRIPRALERGLHYVIVTPDLHRVHHSAWQPETDSNYGAVFPIWDLVFGTFRPEPRDGHDAMRLGLDDLRGGDAHRVGHLLASPLRRELAPEAPRLPARERAA